MQGPQPSPASPGSPLCSDSPSASFDVAGVSGSSGWGGGAWGRAGLWEGGGCSYLVSNPRAERRAGGGGASLECFQMFPGRVCNFLLSSPSHPLGLPATRLA